MCGCKFELVDAAFWLSWFLISQGQLQLVCYQMDKREEHVAGDPPSWIKAVASTLVSGHRSLPCIKI